MADIPAGVVRRAASGKAIPGIGHCPRAIDVGWIVGMAADIVATLHRTAATTGIAISRGCGTRGQMPSP